MKLIADFWKKNKIGYFTSLIIFTFGALVIYSKQHTKYTYDLMEFISWLPILYICILIVAFIVYLFLGGDKD